MYPKFSFDINKILLKTLLLKIRKNLKFIIDIYSFLFKNMSFIDTTKLKLSTTVISIMIIHNCNDGIHDEDFYFHDDDDDDDGYAFAVYN